MRSCDKQYEYRMLTNRKIRKFDFTPDKIIYKSSHIGELDFLELFFIHKNFNNVLNALCSSPLFQIVGNIYKFKSPLLKTDEFFSFSIGQFGPFSYFPIHK